METKSLGLSFLISFVGLLDGCLVGCFFFGWLAGWLVAARCCVFLRFPPRKCVAAMVAVVNRERDGYEINQDGWCLVSEHESKRNGFSGFNILS